MDKLSFALGVKFRSNWGVDFPYSIGKLFFSTMGNLYKMNSFFTIKRTFHHNMAKLPSGEPTVCRVQSSRDESN
jgi:hypothetical protein